MSFLTSSPNQQLLTGDARVAYERRVGPRFALAAGAAAVLLMAGSILQLVGPHTKVEELTLDLITENKRVGLDITAAVLNAIGWLALSVTMWHLFGSTRARNERTAPFMGWLAVLGGVLAALAGLIDAFLISGAAHSFASDATQGYPQAYHLTSGTGFTVIPLLGLVGALSVALSLVLLSLAAMRVGILTKMLGYIGMLAGALVLIQITQIPIVQAYWLGALALLFAGRWPTGMPPAWKTGRAEKWPTGQEIREQRIRSAGERPARGRGAAAPEPQTAGAPTAAAQSPAVGAVKRKRKRRK